LVISTWFCSRPGIGPIAASGAVSDAATVAMASPAQRGVEPSLRRNIFMWGQIDLKKPLPFCCSAV
jgi:hypothetical protein